MSRALSHAAHRRALRPGAPCDQIQPPCAAAVPGSAIGLAELSSPNHRGPSNHHEQGKRQQYRIHGHNLVFPARHVDGEDCQQLNN